MTPHHLYTTFAQAFGLDPAITQQSGTTILPNDEYTKARWHTFYPVGQQIVIPTAPELVHPIQQVLQQQPATHQATPQLFANAWGADAIQIDDEQFYVLTPEAFKHIPPPQPFTVRQLQETDRNAFQAFLGHCTEDDIASSDVEINHDVAYGIFDGERIVSMASVFEWLGCLDIGILTDPTYRGKGLAKTAVSATAKHILQDPRPIFYRHETSNIASGRIAQAVGYAHVTAVYSMKVLKDVL